MNGKQRITGIAGVIAVLGLAAPAAAEQGAIAYSPSTDEVVSVSLNIFTLREVQIKALESCSADDCRILTTFQPGECVAVASSDKRFGHGKAQSQAEAEALAMEGCSNGGEDPNCRLMGQMCAEE